MCSVAVIIWLFYNSKRNPTLLFKNNQGFFLIFSCVRALGLTEEATTRYLYILLFFFAAVMLEPFA